MSRRPFAIKQDIHTTAVLLACLSLLSKHVNRRGPWKISDDELKAVLAAIKDNK